MVIKSPREVPSSKLSPKLYKNTPNNYPEKLKKQKGIKYTTVSSIAINICTHHFLIIYNIAQNYIGSINSILLSINIINT